MLRYEIKGIAESIPFWTFG